MSLILPKIKHVSYTWFTPYLLNENHSQQHLKRKTKLSKKIFERIIILASFWYQNFTIRIIKKQHFLSKNR